MSLPRALQIHRARSGIRFSSSQNAEALGWLSGAGRPGHIRDSKQSTIDFLLPAHATQKRIFRAFRFSQHINKITGSDKESISSLSNSILKDFSLPTRFCVWSFRDFRQSGGGSISQPFLALCWYLALMPYVTFQLSDAL